MSNFILFLHLSCIKIMITKSFKKNNSDFIGAFASGLCLIHCIATPILFIAQTCSATCCTGAPTWWSNIDFLFIGISFFAILCSVKNSSKPWVKSALWFSWFALCLAIINEKINLFHISEFIIYIPAIALVILHLYNKKYCNCKGDKCCVPTD